MLISFACKGGIRLKSLWRPLLATLTRAVDVEELYGIESWGSRYFSVGPHGQLVVDDQEKQVSLIKIIEDLKAQGYAMPMILRFPHILEDRINRLNEAFASVIAEADYKGHYQGVYPVKVNQRRVWGQISHWFRSR
jgi:arginine decarboxylase